MTAFRTLVSAAALGAVAMFVLDPDRGRRRRALARDKARRFVNRGSALVDAARRDASHRLNALRARARSITQRGGSPSDTVLVARVRARLGRVVAHPHAVHVTAEQGHIRLAGPILQREHEALMASVRSVRGVRDVDDGELALYARAEGISALQGNRRRGIRAQLLQESWPPALRVGALAGGGLLALYGQRCGPLSRLALSLAGVALVARAATNVPLARALGIDQDLDEVDADGSDRSRGDDEAGDDESAHAPHAQPGM
ncbi:MAG TPA: hypothetical protein VMB76_05890 [Casimicrobiaceae bacterium]|jgi:hypothetical protein|nr:hypothetical protein [Casimicrobiaceae bacterium]